MESRQRETGFLVPIESDATLLRLVARLSPVPFALSVIAGSLNELLGPWAIGVPIVVCLIFQGQLANQNAIKFQTRVFTAILLPLIAGIVTAAASCVVGTTAFSISEERLIVILMLIAFVVIADIVLGSILVLHGSILRWIWRDRE